jgi:hypothetical protein
MTKKSSPTHFSDDSKWPFRNTMALPSDAALLQQEMGDISSVPQQARPPKAHKYCRQTSNRTRHFRRSSFVDQGGGSKEEAIRDGLGNKIFGNWWRDAGSLGVAKRQWDAV